MATVAVSPFLSVEEYLATSYRPDVDYVDGVLEERNLGEYDHADLQGELLYGLQPLRSTHGIRAVPEVRVQVAERRFRIPDVCILSPGWKKTPIVREPPMLCLEVLSPRDTVKRIRTRSEDFLRMGVPEVWIFDPEKRVAYRLTNGGMQEQRTGILQLEGTPVSIDIGAVFAVLDT